MLISLQNELFRARKPLRAALRSRLVAALVAPRNVDDYLELFDPSWSVCKVRAHVDAIQRERGGGLSLWLTPNDSFLGFRAGQHVLVTIEREGVRHTRCFSFSSAPSERGALRLSMKALPEGKVSGWALELAKPGDVVELSQASGDFVLPDPLPAKLLFISGGSGLTPIISMLRELSRTPHHAHVVWLHYGRRETLLEDEARALTAQPWLRFAFIRTEGPDAPPLALRRLSIDALAQHAPDWLDREAFVCGPSSMHATARALFAEHGRAGALHIESFGVRGPIATNDATPLRARLTFAKSQREVLGTAALSLLEQAEAAGLAPAFGCRMGICHTCKCKKISGVVRNVQTGVVSDAPDDEIRLCVSVPRSDVTLDL